MFFETNQLSLIFSMIVLFFIVLYKYNVKSALPKSFIRIDGDYFTYLLGLLATIIVFTIELASQKDGNNAVESVINTQVVLSMGFVIFSLLLILFLWVVLLRHQAIKEKRQLDHFIGYILRHATSDEKDEIIKMIPKWHGRFLFQAHNSTKAKIHPYYDYYWSKISQDALNFGNRIKAVRRDPSLDVSKAFSPADKDKHYFCVGFGVSNHSRHISETGVADRLIQVLKQIVLFLIFILIPFLIFSICVQMIWNI